MLAHPVDIEEGKKRILRPLQLFETTMSTSVSGAPRKWRRTHGLQPPLHPQQAAACVFLAVFSLLNFGMLIPALHSTIFLYVVSNLNMQGDQSVCDKPPVGTQTNDAC